MVLGNPTFTSWTDLSALAYSMTFAHSEISSGEAALHLETTNWTDWIEISNPSADEQTAIDTITATYDGYIRAIKIVTTAVTDFADGNYFGACFYHDMDSISCVAYSYDSNTTTYIEKQTYDNLYGWTTYNDQVGDLITDKTDVTEGDYPGIDNFYLTS